MIPSPSASPSTTDYQSWNKNELVSRIKALENQLSISCSPSSPSKSSKAKKIQKDLDFNLLPQRKIALRFSYDGSSFSGLAIQTLTSSTSPNSISSQSLSSILSSNSKGCLPSVEEVLWYSLCKARLVDETKGMVGCGWERCGRTDKGVSAAGQVISLWVRSRRIDMREEREEEEEIRRVREEEKRRRDLDRDQGLTGQKVEEEDQDLDLEEDLEWERKINESLKNGDDDVSIYSYGKNRNQNFESKDETEFPYVSALNKILPESIRIQAWSPVRPDFSSRFDCRYRHYKYFFTEGCPEELIPVLVSSSTASSEVISTKKSERNKASDHYTYPANGVGPPLSIPLMRNAASRLLGEHDFRNVCKIDSSKQITNFVRRVDGVSIDLVGESEHPLNFRDEKNVGEAKRRNTKERVYVLNLRGTAFLYHQVRHILSLLFLVGSRLEKPEMIDQLLNVKEGQVLEDWSKLKQRGLDVEHYMRNEQFNGSVPKLSNDSDDHPRGQEQQVDEHPVALPNSTADTQGGHTAASALAAVKATLFAANPNTNPMSYVNESDLIKANAIMTSKLRSNESPEDRLGERISEYVKALKVYETKPSYEMSDDRPLMLWDCGFREKDVQWRSGGYDGPLSSLKSEAKEGEKEMLEFNKVHEGSPRLSEEEIANDLLISSTRGLATLHSDWTKSVIDSEIKKHFLLASPLKNGVLNSSTYFKDSRLQSTVSSSLENRDLNLPPSSLVPIGYGISRSGLEYMKLENRKRDDSAEEKNKRWREGVGKRKAEKKGKNRVEIEFGKEGQLEVEDEKIETRIEPTPVEEIKDRAKPEPRVLDLGARRVMGGPRIMDREIERRLR